jgi:excisionase family DNA binding protein
MGVFVETYFTTKELSDYLKIHEQSIRRWVLNNEIPFHRIHNVIRHRLSEIEIWVGKNKGLFPSCLEGVNENEIFIETENCENVNVDDVGQEKDTVEMRGNL